MSSLRVKDLRKVLAELPDDFAVSVRTSPDDGDDQEFYLKSISVIVATADQPDLQPCLLLEGW